MNIILLKDMDKVGAKHEVVTVKDGYGRNYLIPQGIAVIANDTNMRKLDELKRREEAVATRKLDEHKAIAAKLGASVVKIGAKAGTSGKIFGSVTSIQIANSIKEQLDLDVDRKLIEIEEEIKELGNYSAKVNLHKEVDAKVYFEVISE